MATLLKKTPGKKQANQPKASRKRVVPQAARPAAARHYVDPILFEMGIFKNYEDYAQSINEMVEEIRRGGLRREPENDGGI